MSEKVNLYFCYAHEDDQLRDNLAKQLRGLDRENVAQLQCDHDINAGVEWEQEIDKYLDEAHIILLLVSSDFIDSDYCYSRQMQRAMERHKTGKVRIIPIILRPAHWQGTPFGTLKALPEDGNPVIDSKTWYHQDESLFKAAEEIRKIVLRVHADLQNVPIKKATNQNSPAQQIRYPAQRTPVAEMSGHNELVDPSFVVSELPRQSTESQISTPTLNILLGTTAAFAGLEVMKQTLTLYQFDVKRAAFIFIDASDPPASLRVFEQCYHGIFHIFLLQLSASEFASSAAQALFRGTESHTFMHSTNRPDGIRTSLESRNDAHIAACFSYQQIYDTIDRAVMTVTQGEWGKAGSFFRNEVHVNIVSFIGGNISSGILPDIAIMTREVLSLRQVKQRLNLFCLFPALLKGIPLTDFRWRESNAVACLLELVAYSRLASGYKSIYLAGYNA